MKFAENAFHKIETVKKSSIHNTKSADLIDLYFDKSLEKRVKTLYKKDYDSFQYE
jgi:hypothetical protein